MGDANISPHERWLISWMQPVHLGDKKRGVMMMSYVRIIQSKLDTEVNKCNLEFMFQVRFALYKPSNQDRTPET